MDTTERLKIELCGLIKELVVMSERSQKEICESLLITKSTLSRIVNGVAPDATTLDCLIIIAEKLGADISLEIN